MALPVFYLTTWAPAYFTDRLSGLTMAERRSVCIIVCFFALHGSAEGFGVEGQSLNHINKLFTQEQCLTILATDLETYNGISFEVFNL